MQLLRCGRGIIAGLKKCREFDDSAVFGRRRCIQNPQAQPARIRGGRLQLAFAGADPGIGMQRGPEVVDVSAMPGAVTRPHQGFGRVSDAVAAEQRTAAVDKRGAAAAGTKIVRHALYLRGGTLV